MVNPSENNRLKGEKSPYLLQHVKNPVDWFPWTKEAFHQAQKTDRPIFLSIGYSTCHWCHVMARESFMDSEVAARLNQSFVSIKVDREERPDIDKVYMAFCQALTGHGGWPLTVIMTPTGLPFFAGTYFPKKSQRGHPGLLEILAAVSREWEENRAQLLETGQQLTEKLKGFVEGEGRVGEVPLFSLDRPQEAFLLLQESFDPVYGGFGGPPKFPTPSHLFFLLRYWERTGEKKALEMVEKTLEGMYRGGLYDHLGSGFSRYSTDREWLVPHFEKMLYDNALLVPVYLEAFQVTKKEIYKQVAQEVMGYLLQEMQSPEGGFYSAQDADTEGVEGGYYLWDLEEVEGILKGDAPSFCQYYHLTAEGNFSNKNILHLLGSDLSRVNEFQGAKEKLLSYRKKRAHLFVDDKILTGWNGLLLAALSMAGRILKEASYVEAGEELVSFLFHHLYSGQRLFARYRQGEGAILGTLDDYAFLIHGLLDLYQTTQKEDYQRKAVLLQGDLDELFWDEERGGYYFYGHHGEELILRPRGAIDGALPSGNSVMAQNLLFLYQLTRQEEYRKKAGTLFQVFLQEKNALANTFLLSALLLYQRPLSLELSIDMGRESNQQLRHLIAETFLPFSTLQVKPTHGEDATLTACSGNTCYPPRKGIGEIETFFFQKNNRDRGSKM